MLQVGCSPTILRCWNSWIGPDGNIFPRCKSPVTPPEWIPRNGMTMSYPYPEFLSKQRVGNGRFLAFLNISSCFVGSCEKSVYLPTPELTWFNWQKLGVRVLTVSLDWAFFSALSGPIRRLDRFANWTDRRAKEISRYEAVSTVLHSVSQDRSRWILYDPITTWRDHFFNLFIFATW